MDTEIPLYLPKYECTFMSRKPESMNVHSCLACVTHCKQTNVTVKHIKGLICHAPLTVKVY